MKHVGRMKNNSARLVIAYRTLPGDPYNCLIVGTQGLPDSHHDTLMSLIESDSGQQANELADILSVRRFPDGTVMLGFLHTNGHLKKVPTSMVLMTPDSQTQLPLDELNRIIATQKGVRVEDLAVTDGSPATSAPVKTKVAEKAEVIVDDSNMTPAAMRSKADALFKEAQKLRKEADAIDPPKKKSV